MKQSFRHARGLGLASLGLIALAAGCSREAPPPRASTTPTFESRVGESMPGEEMAPGEGMQQPGVQQPGMQQPGMQQPGMQQPGMQGQQPGMGMPPGSQQAPGGQAPAAPEMGAPQTGATAMSEQQMCDELLAVAMPRAEDVTGGVALVLTPKAGNEISIVREHAKRIEQSLSQPAGAMPAPPGAPGEKCMLFDIGRQGGTVVVSETPNAVRLLITSGDAATVRSIRSQLRDFAKTNGRK